MTTDHELLRRYVEDRSEQAFAELVRHRIGLVHGIALRRVGGDVHLAHDVTQKVFVALARGATQLVQHPVLSGWFYITTRNAAAQAVRTERRRHNREQEASIMHETDSIGGSQPDWEKLRANLDEAMDQLSERDRSAVLLRFFEDRSFADVGARLRLTENAARMRVERALEKMHAILARRGVSSTATALGTLLAAQMGQAAPAGLAATVTTTALAGASISSGISAVTFMSITKLQIGIAITLVAAGIGGFVVQRHTNAGLRKQIARLTDQNQEVAALRSENLRLKQSVGAPQTTAANNSPGTSSVSTVIRSSLGSKQHEQKEGVALAPGLTPIKDLVHRGNSTAQTAFSTQLWAAAQGDVELEQSIITFRPDARAKLAALLENLPEPQRSNYGTPERLMASVLAGSPHPVGGMQVLGETVKSPDDVILQTAWQHVDDEIVRHSNVELQRDSTGWRMVVPMILVDRAAIYLMGNINPMMPPAEKK
jgi:RNA polymerase sigma factor (sigma-70 family)